MDWRVAEHKPGTLMCSMPTAKKTDSELALCASMCSSKEFEEYGEATGWRI